MRHTRRAQIQAAAFSACAAFATAQTTDRASLNSAGVQGNAGSYSSSISDDGRFVAFESDASNLVGGDTNVFADVFVRDRQMGLTERVSVSSSGTEANNESRNACISGDGRWVAFDSKAFNLVAGDNNAAIDVFVRDRLTGQTERVSVSSLGVEGFLDSQLPNISDDGRFVAFQSMTPTLVAGDTNGASDAFVHDRQTGQTTRVSVSSAGLEAVGVSVASTISADGRWVAFASNAANLDAGDGDSNSDCFVHDRQTGTTSLVSLNSAGAQVGFNVYSPRLSEDGRWVVFLADGPMVPQDTNGISDIYLRDLQGAQTTLESVKFDGTILTNGSHGGLRISGDGRYIAFHSTSSQVADGFFNGANNVYLHDRTNGRNKRIDISTDGALANGHALAPSVSSDGRYVAFNSIAFNLVSSDTNNVYDVFVHDTQCSMPTTYCTAKVNSLGCSPTIGSSGTASVTAGSGCFVTASNTLNNKFGLLFYSRQGPQAVPFQGGLLCMQGPIVRTAVQNSGGHAPPNDCTGSYSFDLNAYIASGSDAGLVWGASVYCQYWARDPGFAAPNNVSLSDAIRIWLCE